MLYMLSYKENTLGDGAGACPIAMSSMEVGEVMEGQGTTYDFTLNLLLHIGLCICVRRCVTWLGTILQMGCEMGFQTWVGFAIHPIRHALLLWHHCSDCFCLLCCVIGCFGVVLSPQRGWF